MAVDQTKPADAARPANDAPAEAAAAGPAESAEPAEPAEKPDLDETKRKFREALDRKRSAHASAESAQDTGKVHGSHGPAASKRSFRRKSGS